MSRNNGMAPRMPRRRRVDVVIAAISALALLLPVATTVFAAKPASSSRIELSGVNGVRSFSVSAGPSLGDWVTFTTSYPTNVKNPRIEVLCHQGGTLVFGMAGGVDYSFQLGGGASTWLAVGGEADCTANLFYFSFKAGRQTYNWLAATSFHAGG